jgi:hypothetical protein
LSGAAGAGGALAHPAHIAVISSAAEMPRAAAPTRVRLLWASTGRFMVATV